MIIVSCVYGQAVLHAFEEVETALENEALFAEEEMYLRTVVEENERAAALARFSMMSARSFC